MNQGTVFSISFSGPPAILTQPRTEAVLAGGEAALTVAASGGDLSYQWLYNGKALPNATNVTLTLLNLERANSGLYAVRVTNTLGSAISSNVVLNVVVPQELSVPILLPDRTFQLGSTYDDGWPVSLPQLSIFRAQISSDLVNWLTLTNELLLMNGRLMLRDPIATNEPARFYRIVQFQ
jgi:hypothetical protein